MPFCRLLYFKMNFNENCFNGYDQNVKCLDPDQARRPVGPDLGLNCLLMLSVDATGR